MFSPLLQAMGCIPSPENLHLRTMWRGHLGALGHTWPYGHLGPRGHPPPTKYKIPSVNPPFPGVMYTDEGKWRGKDRHSRRRKKAKSEVPTFQNRPAWGFLCVNPDCFVGIFTQHVVVPVLTISPKFAVCEVEHCAGGWGAWGRNPDRTPTRKLGRFWVSTG